MTFTMSTGRPKAKYGQHLNDSLALLNFFYEWKQGSGPEGNEVLKNTRGIFFLPSVRPSFHLSILPFCFPRTGLILPIPGFSLQRAGMSLQGLG